MPALQAVRTILLRITQSHIDQARAIRAISTLTNHIPIISTCPVAIAAREFFARPCIATDNTIEIFEDNVPLTEFNFSHDGFAFIDAFDYCKSVHPTTITLKRNF